MKKLLVIALAVLFLGFAGSANAYDGDFEMSGHINTGFGYQYNGTDWSAVGLGAFTQEGMIPIRTGGQAVTATTKNNDNSEMLFYAGDVELDIAKTFGENIRLRTDIDFLRNWSNSYMGAFGLNEMIEQAYATVNIPVGYGLEFMIGRFNAPMGFEAVDNNNNDLPFHTMVFNFLRPQNLTGIKFYYPFSDLVDLHVWLANNLRDVSLANSNYGDIPAGGLRLGFTWGMEGQESTFGIGGAFSPETAQANEKWDDWSWLADIDFNIWANDVFAIGGEAIFRRDGARTGNVDNYYYGGILNLHYLFSDVWDGTLRYTYVHDVNGSVNGTYAGAAPAYSGNSTLVGTGVASDQYHRYANNSATGYDAQYHQIDLGINYHITDGAKIMTMYRFDMALPDDAGGGNGKLTDSGMGHTVAANFAYEF